MEHWRKRKQHKRKPVKKINGGKTVTKEREYEKRSKKRVNWGGENKAKVFSKIEEERKQKLLGSKKENCEGIERRGKKEMY